MKKTWGVRFRWRTTENGHEWRIQKGVLRLVPNPGGRWDFAPEPGLFRKFAGLRISDPEIRQEEILTFANKHGDIIALPTLGRVRYTTAARGVEKELIREHATMETWYSAIQHMRRAVDLWDRINDPRQHEELRHIIVRCKDAITYEIIHRPLNKRRRSETVVLAVGKELDAYPVGNVLVPARVALKKEIMRALADDETPSHSIAYLTPEMLKTQLVVSPTNLLAYMWLTFARVVSGEIEERRCRMCPEHFYVGHGPGLQRDDTATCSAACRQRACRQRKKLQ